jgi:hypothetical protein
MSVLVLAGVDGAPDRRSASISETLFLSCSTRLIRSALVMQALALKVCPLMTRGSGGSRPRAPGTVAPAVSASPRLRSGFAARR